MIPAFDTFDGAAEANVEGFVDEAIDVDEEADGEIVDEAMDVDEETGMEVDIWMFEVEAEKRVEDVI